MAVHLTGVMVQARARRMPKKKNWIQIQVMTKGITLDYRFKLTGDPEVLMAVIGISPDIIRRQLLELLSEDGPDGE